MKFYIKNKLSTVLSTVVVALFIFLPSFAHADYTYSVDATSIFHVSSDVNGPEIIDISGLPNPIHLNGDASMGFATTSQHLGDQLQYNSQDLRSYSTGPLSSGLYNLDYYHTSDAVGSYYYLDFAETSNCVSNSSQCYSDTTDASFYWVLVEKVGAHDYQIYGGSPVDTSTRIDSMTPASEATLATSTSFTFGATGYLNSSDFYSGANNMTLCALSAQGSVGQTIFQPIASTVCNYTFTFPITSSGAWSFSTTTNVQNIGGYVLTGSLTGPFASFLGFNLGTNTLVSSSTTFIVASTTLGDQLALGRLALLENLAVATSSSAAADACNPTSGVFSPVYCALGMVVPSSAEFQLLGDDVSNILSEGPWGFLGTTMLIVGGHYFVANSTVLPEPTFNLSDTHLPGTAGTVAVDLSPWSALGSSTALLQTAVSPKDNTSTLRDIIEPGWDVFVLLMFVLAIFGELVGFGGKVVQAN